LTSRRHLSGKKNQTRPTRRIIIAIDGPSASGKSTTARGVAPRLGYKYIDTGAMYRAITLKVLENGIDPDDSVAIAELVKRTTVQQSEGNGQTRCLLDGIDVTDRVRSPEVDRAIGPVCEAPEVRARMVTLQRRLARGKGVVLEGRDIGTVVFPNAELKVYLVADLKERARRRMRQAAESAMDSRRASSRESDGSKRGNTGISLEFFENSLRSRDVRDSHRQISPLARADDARVLDTTNLTIEEQIDIIVDWARAIIDRKNEIP